MSKRATCFIMLLLAGMLAGCSPHDAKDPLFSENTRLKIDIPKDFGIFDYDGQYLYASSFAEEKAAENEEVSVSDLFYHRIAKDSGKISSAKAGAFSIGFHNLLHMGDHIYTTIDVKEKDEKNSDMAVAVLPNDANSDAKILSEMGRLSRYAQLKKLSDDEIIIFNPLKTSIGYDYEILLYRITDKSLTKIIRTSYDNGAVQGKVVQGFGADENSNRIILYVDEYDKDSTTTLLPEKTSVEIYDTEGKLLREHILELAGFMDLSHEFKDMKDFVRYIFFKNNVIVLQTKNGRVKAYIIEKNGLREILFEGASDNIHSMQVLNNKIQDRIYILFKDSEKQTTNFLYMLNTDTGSYKKAELNFDRDRINFFSIIPSSDDDTLLCGITKMDPTGEEAPEKLYFLVNEKDLKNGKNLISKDLLFENKEKANDINE